jgi:hypothetical protein
MVRFSTGANEHINRELESEEDRAVEPCVGTEQKSEFNPESDDPSETLDGSPFEIDEDSWCIIGIGRVDTEGEDIYEVKQTSVQCRRSMMRVIRSTKTASPGPPREKSPRTVLLQIIADELS